MARVVSLLPAATEIAATLGGADMLVGVSHECDYPEYVRRLPRVTRSAVDPAARPGEVDRRVRELSGAGAALYAMDEALLAALEPDVILTQAVCDVCAVSEADVRALASRLPHRSAVVTLDTTSLAGVLSDIQRVGAALHLADESDELCAGIRMRLRAVHGVLAKARAPRPGIAVIEWTEPLFAAGHWVPEMLHKAGGRDVLASPGQHSRMVSIAEVRDAAADVLIIAPCGYDLARATTTARELIAKSEWSWPSSTSLWAVDANALTSRPGPRLARGIEVLARILHPTLFGPPPPALATRIA